MLWLVEVFEWFWLHRVIVIQSIQDDFWWACRKKYTCMVYHKKKTRHTFIEAKKKKIPWMPGIIFIICQGGGRLCEYKSVCIHRSPCFCSVGFFILEKAIVISKVKLCLQICNWTSQYSHVSMDRGYGEWKACVWAPPGNWGRTGWRLLLQTRRWGMALGLKCPTFSLQE